jgi:hypothetical protein
MPFAVVFLFYLNSILVRTSYSTFHYVDSNITVCII